MEENDRAKKFKESPSSSALNAKISSVENKVTEMKTQIEKQLTDMKTQIDYLVNTLTISVASNQQFKEEMQSTLATITNSIQTLSTQMNEIKEKDQKREQQISNMDKRINNIEQQMIAKNIEIKNVENKQLSATEVIKKIAESLNVELKEEDINRAYRLKKKENKIIIEFSSLNKKLELMTKIERHRIEAKVINGNDDNSFTLQHIYINDQLTYNNRQLLWIAKTKAREAKWKYVWVKNGIIFARRNENSSSIIINNSTDIELITPTN